MTPAMVEIPQVRLVRRARYGRWSAFPVDQARFYASFRRHVEVKDHISKYKSFTAVDRVEERLRSLDKRSLTGAHRLALYRAFHTAGLGLADRTDDSHGNVGQLRRDAWHTYLGIDWQATELRAEDYWADVCDLVVFEPYALGGDPSLARGARRSRRADRGGSSSTWPPSADRTTSTTRPKRRSNSSHGSPSAGSVSAGTSSYPTRSLALGGHQLRFEVGGQGPLARARDAASGGGGAVERRSPPTLLPQPSQLRRRPRVKVGHQRSTRERPDLHVRDGQGRFPAGAPGRTRTYAPGSGGRCPEPAVPGLPGDVRCSRG